MKSVRLGLRYSFSSLHDVLSSQVFARLRCGSTAAKQRRQLTELTDEVLKDMGISRADASRGAQRPFWDDPFWLTTSILNLVYAPTKETISLTSTTGRSVYRATTCEHDVADYVLYTQTGSLPRYFPTPLSLEPCAV